MVKLLLKLGVVSFVVYTFISMFMLLNVAGGIQLFSNPALSSQFISACFKAGFALLAWMLFIRAKATK